MNRTMNGNVKGEPAMRAENGQVMLECRGLTRVYHEGPQDVTVLDGLDLEVRAGERLT